MSQNILHVENITMQFGGVVAVNNLSVDVNAGEIVALIGPNGAGKTTAFNCITGVYEPTNGRVDFLGQPMIRNHPQGKMVKSYSGQNAALYTHPDLDDPEALAAIQAAGDEETRSSLQAAYDKAQAARTEALRTADPHAFSDHVLRPSPDRITHLGVARTFQNIRLFKELSVLDNVKVGLHNHHKYSTLSGILRLPSYYKVEKEMDERAMELLKVFDLDKEFDYKASNLPYGKQRKLEIARALATEPKLLLLDEPAAGMNPNETAELMKTIRFVRDHFDMTVLLIEHDMKLVSGICERLTVLNFGHMLAEGPTSEVLSNPEVIKAYLGE